MHLKVQNCLLDPKKQQASALFFLKLGFETRHEPRDAARMLIEDCTDSQANDIVDGLRVFGVTFKVAESADFPINPDRIFLNEALASDGDDGPRKVSREAMPKLSWLKCNQGVLSAQLVFTATLDVPFKVNHYPFDRHVVAFRLATRVKSWRLPNKRPDWAKERGGFRYSEDPHLVSEEPALSSPFVHEAPVVCWREEKPVFCLLVSRSPWTFFFGSALPVFFLVMVGLVSFLVGENDTGDKSTPVSLRMGAIFSSSVAITTYEQAVRQQMPEVSYLTYADTYFNVAYFFHLVAALTVVFVRYMRDQEPLHGINDGATFDSVTTGILIAVWAVWHIVPFLLLLRRTPWRDLINETMVANAGVEIGR